MNHTSELFGSMVFSDVVMQERLPKKTLQALRASIEHGERLSPKVASVVAEAMKDWAIEKGATHFTHWFQPMTGITAEKHDSFITPLGNGVGIMEFSSKELTQGEPDASSFPSGGLRSTFEARGYTAWDPTSYAFVRDGILYIPTAFCSYGGEALDKKTPLLRSMEALNAQAVRVLRLFGNKDVMTVRATAGPEQEYFLIDQELYKKRKDLIYTGRTLFGARPPKGQELEDHYFGTINSRVAAFMKELNEELWKLGVPARTEHNEVAPSQHELAPVFGTVNIAADQNQLTMEMMRRVAEKHGMVCLLHEKPFAGVNGSGKHNNWSMSTDTGENLLEPGDTPAENARFLTFLCAVIKAVDEYQDLLRISTASAGNDHRLGASEAPPAIISIYLGDELSNILEALKNETPYISGEKEQFQVGVHSLPSFPKDTTDRNRTSPFAFTGNKFEFRMVGSSASISEANIVLNTIVAEALRQFADRLEKSSDFKADLQTLLRDEIRAHSRILFNGNGYGAEWEHEAEKRGLLNMKSTPDCLPHMLDEKNIKLFETHKVLSETEVRARCEIKLENYCKVINIEGLTMVDMVMKDIIPSVNRYISALADSVAAKEQLLAASPFETDTARHLSNLVASTYATTKQLEEALIKAKSDEATESQAKAYRNTVFPLMNELRIAVDEMETLTDETYWPYPSYGRMLFHF